MAKFVKDAICNYLEGTKIMTKMRNKLRCERRKLSNIPIVHLFQK